MLPAFFGPSHLVFLRLEDNFQLYSLRFTIGPRTYNYQSVSVNLPSINKGTPNVQITGARLLNFASIHLTSSLLKIISIIFRVVISWLHKGEQESRWKSIPVWRSSSSLNNGGFLWRWGMDKSLARADIMHTAGRSGVVSSVCSSDHFRRAMNLGSSSSFLKL